MVPPSRLVLASASPRRRDLLHTVGIGFEVVVADVDESWRSGESTTAYVERLATAKADAVAGMLGRPAATVVLAADTTVDLDGQVLAKPVDDAEARWMLRSLSGRSHLVHTAVACITVDAVHRKTVTTAVTFAPLTDEVIDWYLTTGEHRDKAGAYGMQGAAGAFVERIEGSPTNVIGLPLAETLDLLRRCGLAVVGGC